MTNTFLRLALLSCLLAGSLSAQYDLLLKGGHVIDARNEIDGAKDVAIKDGRVAAVADSIDASQAEKVVDVSGLYVTPGLVDIHVHVYAGTGQKGTYTGDNSVYPDGFSFRSGVTTMVDVGGAGWRNFPDFKQRIIDRVQTRVLSMLNIVGTGMGGGEIEQNLDDMDADATAKMAKQYPDTIVGVKCAHYTGPEWDPVERAVEAGTKANIPVMIDFGHFREERPFEELVTKKLRPGDIYTHAYLGRVPMLDENNKPRPYLFEAQKRGVKFDVGHGGGSFWWMQAVPAVKNGFIADSISTDLHIGSMNAGMKNMANVMSKFLALGLPLADVVRKSTWEPAKQIKRTDLGNLSVGSVADVAVFRVDEGEFGFLDVRGARYMGDQLLSCELTLRDGRVRWDLNGRAGTPWEQAQGNTP
jgi:dihydroorotase